MVEIGQRRAKVELVIDEVAMGENSIVLKDPLLDQLHGVIRDAGGPVTQSLDSGQLSCKQSNL